MDHNLPSSFVVSAPVARALRSAMPVVALESAVITHGLPRPENLQLAQSLEQAVREAGATPATIALLEGRVRVGLDAEDLHRLAYSDNTRKISRRDFAIAIAGGEHGGTTVAGTLIAAAKVGIRVFATGGIGGVHRNAPFDVSADLPELGRSPLVVVCAGAKAILDLPATLEMLETLGVPVIGYQTDDFPAFYSRFSGLPVTTRADDAQTIARMARAHWAMGLESAMLVVQPPPEEAALPAEEIERVIQTALRQADAAGVRGAAVTPYLLSRVAEISAGASLRVNLALLQANATLAAQIAAALYPPRVI